LTKKKLISEATISEWFNSN